jgi:hypothetical protein
VTGSRRPRALPSTETAPGQQVERPVVVLDFFFHATMVYAILRHNGVDLGKMDYIGSLPTKDG